MKKEQLRIWVLKVVLLLTGLTIAHLGVTLFLQADLGSDPFNVLIQGLFRAIPWPEFMTHGNVHVGVSFLIILVLRAVDRSYIQIGTLLCMILGGPIIDVFTVLLGGVIHSQSPFLWRVACLALGCVILAFGMTIVIKSRAGTGPNDLVAVVISDKSKKKFSVIRILTDVAFVVIGFALGGSFGVGTLICAFCVGPVAGVFLPINGRLIDRVLKKVNA